eukprot:4504119-Prymnesium_polylepis.1
MGTVEAGPPEVLLHRERAKSRANLLKVVQLAKEKRELERSLEQLSAASVATPRSPAATED